MQHEEKHVRSVQNYCFSIVKYKNLRRLVAVVVVVFVVCVSPLFVEKAVVRTKCKSRFRGCGPINFVVVIRSSVTGHYLAGPVF